MQQIDDLLKKFPRVNLSILPTPLQYLPKLSEVLEHNIYIKRDDLTGFSFGGNKTRKLDFLMAEAIVRGYTAIIGIGANQSNFCRILANAAVRYNLKVHLILRGKKVSRPTGNLRIDHLLGADVHHVDTSDSQVAMAAAQEVQKQLEASGERVFLLPPGGSVPLGALGYVAGWSEIYDDLQRLPHQVRMVMHASSSAGTQAGLVLGQAISGWNGRIIGVSVDEPKARLMDNVKYLALAAAQLLNIEPALPPVEVEDGFIGPGYGIPTAECRAAVELFAKTEGIYLDYVYTGKAAAALIAYCRTGKIAAADSILFLHTGGYVQLFE